VFSNEDMAAYHLATAIDISKNGLEVLLAEMPGITENPKFSSIIMAVRDNR
jgi:hypothetical protein